MIFLIKDNSGEILFGVRRVSDTALGNGYTIVKAITEARKSVGSFREALYINLERDGFEVHMCKTVVVSLCL